MSSPAEPPQPTGPPAGGGGLLPWADAPAVRLNGDLPPAERFRQLPADSLDRCRELLADLRTHLPTGAGGLALAVNARTKGRWRAEAEALAHLLGSTWAEVLVANCTYDLALSGFACSTAALATPSGPVLARNMDWIPAGPLARASLLVETRYAEGPGGSPLTVWNAGWPGGIGVVTGQSSRGFALALNAVGVAGAPDLLGCPVLLFLRRVLTVAKDFSDAVVRIRRERLVCGAIVTVVGRDNSERVVVERTPRRSGVIWGEGDDPLVATNHLRVLDAGGGSEAADPDGDVIGHSHERLAALYDAVPRGEVSDGGCFYALTEPDVVQNCTAQHIICRPTEGTVRLAVPRALLTPGVCGW
ncbi:C45 family autoproteolytic acyltransferase/hydolase [Alienimonas sp. DA493]|uniref:C45 family autoproteolytic acyltransferase/hydolase n=1 Tax=Alienimonas sp. DA493 TaxID=3373605 RepID=UPI0037549494